MVKDETEGRAFTGAFYGYITGADDKGYCATHSLLHCPDIDFLTSPSAYDFRDLRVDVVHPSPLGHRVAAHAIRDALCARGWVCSGGPTGGPSCAGYRAADFPRVRGY